jgi:NAD+ synthase (glutamine-hydrolysing)
LWFNQSNYYKKDPFEDTECDLIIAINASPSLIGKVEKRIEICKNLVKRKNCDLMYVNQVGGYDDVIFDGSSFYMSKEGHIKDFCPYFIESYVDNIATLSTGGFQLSKNAFIYNQLVFGINEYCYKCGFKKVVVGSSGGIDSALVLTLAAAALGPSNVTAITMPSKFSSKGSISDSEILCNNLGIKLYNAPIEITMSKFDVMFESNLEQDFTGLTNENTQARIRGTLLMAYSNKTGALVLSTGNKSELSVGYCTLYGDMNGGLSPISDLYKTEVFELAKWINKEKEIIPWNIINKAPSAELAPNQKDTDSLPEYKVLDQILKHLIEGEQFRQDLRIPDELIDKIHRMILRNEFKRRQAAPTIKIHDKSFGYGRRFPLAQNYTII